METTTKEKPKFVSFLLDETGSMHDVIDDTIGGFNAYVETLKKDGGDIVFSLVSFDSNRTQRRYVAEPIDKVEPLTRSNYRPGAATPLIDASVKIIKATEDAVRKRGDEPSVLVVIQTDGYENASVEYTSADLTALIKEKTATGWQFVFLGAGLDAFDAARDAGIQFDRRKMVSYGKQHSRAMFEETARKHVQFLKYSYDDALNYSQSDRDKVGDKQSVDDIDLTPA